MTSILLAGMVAMAAYWRRALSLDGALAAMAIGAAVFSRGGLRGASTLLAFFVSSSALSRLRERRGVRRNAWQVLANGGAATVALALGRPGGFVGGLAAAGADTWATEIGMLARARPRSITTWREVERGMSGGVTPAGLLGSVGGAAAVGVAWWLAGGSRRVLALALLCGVFGSILDSLLGATVQALYTCERCGARDERPRCGACGEDTRLVRGLAAINNDTVNAAATTAAAGIGAWIGSGG